MLFTKKFVGKLYMDLDSYVKYVYKIDM